jgi:hypothetical protein
VSRPRVIVNSRFREYAADLRRGEERALGHAASVGVAAARTAETDVKTGRLRASIRASTVYETPRGKEVAIYVPKDVFYGRFINYGTLGKRGRKLKQPGRRTRATHSESGKRHGVTGLHFLEKGRRAAAARLVSLVERELR